MFPQDEPVAIEVKILERKKVKLLSELERLEKVKRDKFRDSSGLQNQLGLLDRQLEIKKKEYSLLLKNIEETKSSSVKYLKNEFSAVQSDTNEMMKTIKNKEKELSAREARIKSIQNSFSDIEANLNKVRKEQHDKEISLSLKEQNLKKDYIKLEELRVEITKEKEIIANNLVLSKRELEENKRLKEESKAYIQSQKEKADKNTKESEDILKEANKKLSILTNIEKTLNIKEEELKNKEIYLLDKERTLVRSAREIELKQSKYG